MWNPRCSTCSPTSSRHRDRVVTKNELLDDVWGDRFVSESALHQPPQGGTPGVGDDGSAAARHPHRVRPRLPVRRRRRPSRHRRHPPHGPPAASRRPAADTALPSSDPLLHGGRRHPHRLRHRSATGPPLVKAANWMTHLDYDGDNPVWRHWLEGLGAHRTLVRYDERGCGTVGLGRRALRLRGLGRRPAPGRRRRRPRPLPAARRVAGRGGGHRLRRPLPRAGSRPRAARLLRPRPPRAGHHRRAAPRGRPRPRGGPRRLGPRRPVVPPGVHVAVPPRRHAASSGRSSTSCSAARPRPTTPCASSSTFATIDVTELAPQVKCPTLLLHSRDDLRVQPLERPASWRR